MRKLFPAILCLMFLWGAACSTARHKQTSKPRPPTSPKTEPAAEKDPPPVKVKKKTPPAEEVDATATFHLGQAHTMKPIFAADGKTVENLMVYVRGTHERVKVFAKGRLNIRFLFSFSRSDKGVYKSKWPDHILVIAKERDRHASEHEGTAVKTTLYKFSFPRYRLRRIKPDGFTVSSAVYIEDRDRITLMLRHQRQRSRVDVYEINPATCKGTFSIYTPDGI